MGDGVPNQKNLHPTWRAYRRWLFLMVGCLGSYFAWAAVMQDASPSVRRNPWLGVPSLVVLAVGVIGLLRVWYFRCPNCRSTFHQKSGSWGFSLGKCQHCGLPLWEDPWGAQPPR